MAGGLLNARVDDLVDESLRYMGRWLKMAKQVSVVVERGLNFFKELAVLSFAFMAIEINGKFS
jgi:hypothetical protein